MTLNTQPLAAAGAPHLRARGLRLARGGRVLHDGIDLTLAPGDRLAVVGENGRGKTTLLEALAGVLEADGGTIERHGSLGVVRQELVITTQPGAAGGAQPAGVEISRTVGDLLDELLERPLAALAELDDAAESLAHDDSPAAAARYDAALATAIAAEAWDAPRRLEVGLEEVGAITDRTRPLVTLSVGQRYRVRLAGVIAAGGDLLLLDEPTNHLDARGLDYLTAMLRAHPGALAVVSHDRALLGEVATAYLDLDPTMDGSPLLVSGGLEAWQLARRRARAAWEDAYRVQREEHHRLSGHADAARSRLSTGWRPDKGTGKHQRQSRAPGIVRAMNERIQRLEEHRLDVPPPPPRLHLTDSGTPAGVPLLRADAVRVDQNAVRVDQPECVEQAESAAPPTDPESAGAARPRLERTTLRLEGGDRLLVVGPNGAGKTTLLRVLAGEVRPTAGTVRVLGRARIALLEQEDEGPSAPSASPEAWSSSAPWTEHPPGRDQPAHRGSPGERRRRALSRLFAARPDVALLDEPTNHLGISGVDDLLAALESTSAAIVVATHDRSVLRALSHWPRLELGGPAPSR